MKILFASTSSNNVFTVMGSLESLHEHDLRMYAYDGKWHQETARAVAANPGVRDELRMNKFHLPRERVSCDEELLQIAADGAGDGWTPDMIVYISAWEGDFVPAIETLAEMNAIVPVIHLLFDGGDPPWWAQLVEFERAKCFTLTVNIDGNHAWPGGRRWGELDDNQRISPCLAPMTRATDNMIPRVPIPFALPASATVDALTLLTPLDPRPFAQVGPVFAERPYTVAWAGNQGGWVRSSLFQQLQNGVPGFSARVRDDSPTSYGDYAAFLRHSRLVVNVPNTGSGASKHVKGRIVEGAYAGCCLLELRNHATRDWFVPRLEFFEYSSPEECVDVANFLRLRPALCEEVGWHLQQRVLTEHSPRVFWDNVIGAVRERRGIEDRSAKAEAIMIPFEPSAEVLVAGAVAYDGTCDVPGNSLTGMVEGAAADD